MAIILDATGGNQCFNEDLNGIVSWSHTVASDANCLVVSQAGYDSVAGDAEVTGVTYNSVALTKGAGVGGSGTTVQASVWYLIDPVGGTFDGDPHDVVVTCDGTPTSIYRICCGSISLKGVGGLDEAKGESDYGDTPSISLACSEGAWLVDAAGSGASAISGHGTDQTEHFTCSSEYYEGTYKGPVSAGDVTMEHTGGTTTWRHAAAAFYPDSESSSSSSRSSSSNSSSSSSSSISLSSSSSSSTSSSSSSNSSSSSSYSSSSSSSSSSLSSSSLSSSSLSSSSSSLSSSSSSILPGTVCWGHDTGVVQDSSENFVGNWTGTATIFLSGDVEKIVFTEGQNSVSKTWYLGAIRVAIFVNHYGLGTGTPTIEYQTGATKTVCEAAGWTEYTGGNFSSLGWVRIRLSN